LVWHTGRSIIARSEERERPEDAESVEVFGLKRKSELIDRFSKKPGK